MDLVQEIATKELVKELMGDLTAEFLREHLTVKLDTLTCNCCNEDCNATDVTVKILLGAEVITEDVITL